MSVAAHRLGRDTGTLRLRHRPHFLRNEGAGSPWRDAASVADFSGAESKVGRVVFAHERELAPASPENKPKSARLASRR
jgi:hypothetical protein